MTQFQRHPRPYLVERILVLLVLLFSLKAVELLTIEVVEHMLIFSLLFQGWAVELLAIKVVKRQF